MDGGEREEEGDRTAAMFYSRCLLSKKAPLAAIWVAACCFKRLKKRQVTDTHIPSSVDTILLEALPSVTYRILAFLLLGVVRIYSRKVEYLFQDCHETVCDVNRFSVGKKVVPFKDIVRSSYSIILPERYELDLFQLDVADVAGGAYVVQTEDIILQDAMRDKFTQWSLDKHPSEEVAIDMEENCNTQTLVGVSLPLETCSSPQTPHKLSTDHEASTVICTPPDKVISPHHMEIDLERSSADDMEAFQTSREKLRELRFTGVECMDLDMICEADFELLNLMNEYQVQNTDDGDEDALERAPLEKFHVLPEDKEVPSAPEKTPDSEVPDDTGVATQELLILPTPAKKENIQRPCKRKCIIDVPTVLESQVMKQFINDASDLVCKRKKVPHTVIDIWRFCRITTLSKNFLEPLIPCVPLEQQYAYCKKTKEESQPSVCVLAKQIEISVAPLDKPEDVMAPQTPTNSRSTIAPGTPILCPIFARTFVSPRGGDSDGEGPFHLYENVRKEPSMHEEGDFGPSLVDEVNADEGDSQELEKKNGLFARTRTVAKYLHRVIHEKKQQGEKSVPLLPILERKTRAETARFFFEVLVLTTGGLVNVKQRRAYGDVLVQETPKMEATLASC